MNQENTYPIGTPGQKWGADEKVEWLAQQVIQRSYFEEVLSKLEHLKDRFEMEQYGALSVSPQKYPLYALKSRDWDPQQATILVTGGVHGYETSGVQGAIRFLETEAHNYVNQFNLVVAPCVSPWGYETINRWNSQAIDPNRSFLENGNSEESAALIKYVSTFSSAFLAHFDLHETTDTDNTEFRPALAAS